MDKRRHLKVKIKNLAEEARIIRSEERKVHGMEKWELQHHRRTVVRDEARRSLIAYAIIRGKDPSVNESTDWLKRATDKSHVERMVKKYGSQEAIERIEEYRKAA
ncbi:MAG: hypothetical protein QNJ81_02200 [Acidimicrobiia bacterium]|nr:hypothetical protein [Acidimicrobiia bacterium]